MTGFFELSQPERFADVPDVYEDACRCRCPDDQYTMDVDAGSLSIVHVACGKQPLGDWWQDSLHMDIMPVTLTHEPYGNCDGSEWHGEHRCDCGTIGVLTPRPSGQVVAIELAIQVRKSDDDPWRDQGTTIPGMFVDDAKRLLAVHLKAWPDVQHRLVRRTTSMVEEDVA